MKTKITSYEAACKALKINPKNLPIVNKLTKDEQKRIIAFYKLSIIVKALNDGWAATIKNKDEWKYYPYFYNNGKSLVYNFCNGFTTGSEVPLALTYKNSELAIYAGKKFIKLYRDYLQ